MAKVIAIGQPVNDSERKVIAHLRVWRQLFFPTSDNYNSRFPLALLIPRRLTGGSP